MDFTGLGYFVKPVSVYFSTKEADGLAFPFHILLWVQCENQEDNNQEDNNSIYECDEVEQEDVELKEDEQELDGT